MQDHVWAQMVKKSFGVTKKYINNLFPKIEVKKEKTMGYMKFINCLSSNEVPSQAIGEMFKTFLSNPENLKLMKEGFMIENGKTRNKGKIFTSEKVEFIFKEKTQDGSEIIHMLNLQEYDEFIFRLYEKKSKENSAKKAKNDQNEKMFENYSDYIFCSLGIAIKEYSVRMAYPTPEDASAIEKANKFHVPHEPDQSGVIQGLKTIITLFEENTYGKLLSENLPPGTLNAIHKGIGKIDPSKLSTLPMRAKDIFNNNNTSEGNKLLDEFGAIFQDTIQELETVEGADAHEQEM